MRVVDANGQIKQAGGGSGDTLPVVDTTSIVKGSADGTKQVKIEADGITTGTTRTWTAPDANTTIPVFSQVITFSGPTAARTVTLPDSNLTVVGLATSQTLTNKTIDLTDNTLVGSVAEFNAALESADFYTTGGTDVALADGGTGASLSDPNADRILFWDDSGGGVTWLEVGSGLSISGTTLSASATAADVILVQERQTHSTDASSYTSGAWRTRELNTEVLDTGNHCSVASNQMTLAAGTYEAWFWASGYNVAGHKCKLRDITNGADLLLGSMEYTGYNSNSRGEGRFTLAGSTVVELQYEVATTGIGGYSQAGALAGSEVNVYASVFLRKVA